MESFLEEIDMLVKDKKNGILTGVCAGLGNYLSLDPLIVRLAFIVGVVFFGFGIIPYLLLWLLMPAGNN